ncbi:hypothetical protein [Glutamicibacter sp.]|uniref:hypothetical protein n=1 Tax=Glutamicibacter sp. TaxID=1931995 RepID=UPI003D6B0577
MIKRSAFWALPLATAMALTGCSSGSSPEPSASLESQAPSADPSQPAEQSVGDALSAEEVESIASQIVEGDKAVQVIGNEQMQKQLAVAKDANLPSGIKPEKCADMNAEYSVTDLTGSVAATATSSSEAVGKVVQVFSLTDEATRKRVAQALTLDDLEDCKTVTIDQGGQEIQAERQILALDVQAEQSLTMSTQMDAGGGQILTSVAVQALDGNNFVLVTLQTGSQQPAELAGQAVELADQAFAEIESVQ